MTYTEFNKDILEAANDGEFDILAHCCNCFHTMGTGIAKKIKEKWPGVYEIDKQTLLGDIRKLGTYSTYSEPGIRIVNLYAQYHYGRGVRQLRYDELHNCLEMLKMRYLMEKKVIAIPYKMGCVNAGGDWNVVEAIIKSVFNDTDFDIKVYRI